MIQCPAETLQSILNKLQNIAEHLQISMIALKLSSKKKSILQLIQTYVEQLGNKLLNNDESSEEEKEYQQIEKQLQKQQNLNRTLLKKEFQYKEYHKSLIEELSNERKNNQHLQDELTLYNKQIKSRDLQYITLSRQRNVKSQNSNIRGLKPKKETIVADPLVQKKAEKQRGMSPIQNLASYLKKTNREDERRPLTAHKRKKSNLSKK